MNSTIYKPHRPKIKEKLFFFISGALISVPFPFLATSLIGYFLVLRLPAYEATLITLVLVAPILEEFAKAYPLFYRHGETERSIFTLAFLVGLGFGLVEFLFYVLALNAPLLIRLAAVFFHASSTTLVAYGIGKNQAFIFYLLAVFLHALNNYLASLGEMWIYANMGVFLLTYILALVLFRRTTEKTIGFWTN